MDIVRLNASMNFPYIIHEIMHFFLQINGQSEGSFTAEEELASRYHRMWYRP